jgi:hypothetical protein
MGAKGVKNHMSALEDKYVAAITNKYVKMPAQALPLRRQRNEPRF